MCKTLLTPLAQGYNLLMALWGYVVRLKCFCTRINPSLFVFVLLQHSGQLIEIRI